VPKNNEVGKSTSEYFTWSRRAVQGRNAISSNFHNADNFFAQQVNDFDGDCDGRFANFGTNIS